MTRTHRAVFAVCFSLVRESGQIEGGELTGYARPLEEEGPLRGRRDLITVIGQAATIGAGEFVQASRRWVNDRTHGVQFRADFRRSTLPTTAEEIEKSSPPV